MKARQIVLFVLPLAAFFSQAVKASSPKLELRSTLPLMKTGGLVSEALLDTSRGLVWIRDFELTNDGVSSQSLEAYSRSGKLLAHLDASQSGFFSLIDIELDPSGQLWALDYGGRVSIFKKPFDLAATHLLAAKTSYPYYPGSIAIDPRRKLAYVTGCWPLGETLSSGCLELHTYRLPGFEKSQSFLKSPPAEGDRRLASRMGLVAVEESSGAVFYARLAAPEVLRLEPPDWKPKKLPLEKWSFEPSYYHADWMKAAKITALIALDRYVVLGIDHPKEARSSVVFFSPSGELLGGMEVAPGRLVGHSTDGALIFASNKDGHWILSLYEIKP